MNTVIGYLIICSAINFFGWIVLGSADFSLKECFWYGFLTELFVIVLVIGYGMIAGWR